MEEEGGWKVGKGQGEGRQIGTRPREAPRGVKAGVRVEGADVQGAGSM